MELNQENQAQPTRTQAPDKWTYAYGVVHSLFFILGSVVINFALNFAIQFFTSESTGLGVAGSFLTISFIPTLAFIGYFIYSLAKKRTKYVLGLITIPGAFIIFFMLIAVLFAAFPMG
jgi:hypothetical protein